MDYKALAEQILEKAGGAENVLMAAHCMTRLRLNLKSDDAADEAGLKALKGVAGVVRAGGQLQIVIGQDVPQVYGEFTKLGDFGNGGSVDEAQEDEGKQQGVVARTLDTIAGIFLPIMPIIAGAGMIKALLAILSSLSLIDASGMEYYFLNFIADSAYYFLPIFLASSAAKKFGCNQYMSMMIGAMLLHPKFTALSADQTWVNVFLLPVKIGTYGSSVIPVLLMTWLLKYVEQFAEKICPKAIKFIARPLITLLIMAPASFCILAPLGGFIGDALVNALLAIEAVAPWVLPTVIGGFMPYLVMTGMHYSLLPAYVSALAEFGHESVVGPGNLPANISQGAVALCVALKTKNKEFRELAISAGISALLGITEPVLYGVNMRLKRPLVAATIGGLCGGFYAGITGVTRFGGGGAGLAAIGLYIGPDPSNVINALISAAIAFVVSFVAMWFIGFEDVPADEANHASALDAAGM